MTWYWGLIKTFPKNGQFHLPFIIITWSFQFPIIWHPLFISLLICQQPHHSSISVSLCPLNSKSRDYGNQFDHSQPYATLASSPSSSLWSLSFLTHFFIYFHHPLWDLISLGWVFILSSSSSLSQCLPLPSPHSKALWGAHKLWFVMILSFLIVFNKSCFSLYCTKVCTNLKTPCMWERGNVTFWNIFYIPSAIYSSFRSFKWLQSHIFLSLDLKNDVPNLLACPVIESQSQWVEQHITYFEIPHTSL